MKKLFFAFVAISALTLVACGSKTAEATETAATETVEAATETVEAAVEAVDSTGAAAVEAAATEVAK